MSRGESIPGRIVVGAPVGLVVVLAVWGFVWQLAGPPSGDPPNWPDQEVLYHGKREGWEVWVTLEGTTPRAGVVYDMRTPEGIRAYVAANERLTTEVFATPARWVPVEITFHRPVGLDAFRALVAQASMEVDRYELRGFEADGRTVSLGGGPADSVLIPERRLQELADRAARRGRPYELAGVYLVVGQIDTAGYEAFSAAGEVFMVDVTKSVAREEIARATGRTIPAKEINVVSPYVALEHLGLTPAGPDQP